MANLGVRTESGDIAHVAPFDGDAIPVGGFERRWENGPYRFRSALVGDEELVHVPVVPGPARVSGPQRRHDRVLQEPVRGRSSAGGEGALAYVQLHVQLLRNAGRGRSVRLLGSRT